MVLLNGDLFVLIHSFSLSHGCDEALFRAAGIHLLIGLDSRTRRSVSSATGKMHFCVFHHTGRPAASTGEASFMPRVGQDIGSRGRDDKTQPASSARAT